MLWPNSKFMTQDTKPPSLGGSASCVSFPEPGRESLAGVLCSFLVQLPVGVSKTEVNLDLWDWRVLFPKTGCGWVVGVLVVP